MPNNLFSSMKPIIPPDPPQKTKKKEVGSRSAGRRDVCVEGPLADAFSRLSQHELRRGEYSTEDKMKAVGAFFMKQNSVQASKLLERDGLKIPPSTIRDWKTQPWWPQAIESVRKSLQAKMEGRIMGLLDQSLDNVDKRLETGDVKMNKQGELVDVPMTGKDSVLVFSILTDKLQLLRGQQSPEDSDKSVSSILDKFNKAIDEAKVKTVVHSQERITTQQSGGSDTVVAEQKGETKEEN